jgi:hypothetical protein
MNTLANIFTAQTTESVGDHSAASPFYSSDATNESFDAFVSRAMSPGLPEQSPSKPSGSEANTAKPNPERMNTLSTHKSSRPASVRVKDTKNASPIEAEVNPNTDATSTPKGSRKDSDKLTDSPGKIEADVIPDNFQNAPAQILPPAPLLCPLPAFLPILDGPNLPTDSGVSQTEVKTAGEAKASAKPAAMGAVQELNDTNSERITETVNPLIPEKTKPAEAKVMLAMTAVTEGLNPGIKPDGNNHLTPPDISNGTQEKLPSSESSSVFVSSDITIASEAFQTHGTPAAKLDVSMKNELNMNNIAGSAEQNLPAGITGHATAAIGSSDNAPVSPNIIDFPSRSLERTYDLVALHGLRFLEIKSDLLQVVIKPGAGIELSLELRQHGDGIEAQAVLQQGNFDQINRHWGELQQRLEQRGIRLAPLTGDENPTAFGGNTKFQQQQQPPEEPNPFAAGAFAELALTAVTIAPSRQPAMDAAASRGWQTWA